MKINLKSILRYTVVMMLLSILSIFALNVSAAPTDEITGLNVKDGIIVSYSGEAEELIIPDTVAGNKITEIGANAFAGNSTLKKITLPDSITYIGTNAFKDCTGLEEAELSSGLTGFGAYAFSGCTSLKEIAIPGSVTAMGPGKGEDHVFSGCTSLTTVTIGEGITDTGAYTFYNCTSLKNVSLPSTLKIIDTWAFGYGDALTSIDLPEGLEEIGSASFYGSGLTEIVMPSSVTKLGTHAFRGCSSLEKAVLSDNIKTITYRAFSGTHSLVEVVFPKNLEVIDKEAFYQTRLKAVNLNDGITRIGEQAFYQNYYIESINLPDSITTIEAGAFYECRGLSIVTFPKSLKTLENNLFYGCYGLKTVNLPESLTAIKSSAFYGCSGIASITLPKSLTAIEDGAFENSDRIFEIYNLSSLDIEIGSAEQGGIAVNAKCVHTSSDDVSCLKTDEEGYLFYVSEAENSLLGYNGIEEYLILPPNIGGNIYSINSYAFYDNKSLKTIEIPDGVEIIGEAAFKNCTGLFKVTFPDSITAIEKGAFAGCTALKNVFYDGSEFQWETIVVGENNKELPSPTVYISDIVFDDTNTNTFASAIDEILDDLAKNIFPVNFILTLLWGVIFIYTKRTFDSDKAAQKRKLIFVVIVCIQWILISGLRADMIGADTVNYMQLFDEHRNASWSSIFENLKDYYLYGETDAYDYEPGYILFEKILGIFTSNHVVYKFVIAIIFMTALGNYVYKNSKDPCLSFVVYSALFYNMFSLTGYRQVVAAAIGILLGYEFIKKRQFGKFLTLVLIASLFHRSTLIFILFYFFANRKLTRSYVLSMVAIIGVMILSRNWLFNYVKVIFGYDDYSGTYGFAQGTFTILLIALTLVAIYQLPIIRQENKNYLHYYNGLILMWAMMPFAMVSPTSMRLVYNFGFILLMFIPEIAKSFKGRNNQIIVNAALMLIFGYFIFSNTPDYQFFWQ